MPKLYHNGQAWQVPGQQDNGATRVDVPTSPAEAAAWLNARAVPAHTEGEAPDLVSQLANQRNPELEQHVAKCADQAKARELEEARRKAASAAAALERDSAEHVAAWIFDQATPAQVEQLFAALGTRFHEQRSK